MAQHDRSTPWVIDLDDPRGADASLTGNKSANLAVARAGGLLTMPGFSITTAAAPSLRGASPPEGSGLDDLRRAWAALSHDGAEAVVARSSSTIEDAGASSMAGRFTSVLDLRTWDAFLDGVRRVLASASHPELGTAPMAVLVQPHLDTERGGVLFGADPVTGDPDHLVVAALAGGPQGVVGGTATGTTLTLSRRGRKLGAAMGAEADDLRWATRRRRRELAQLAARAAELFGGPQDVEWAIDAHGRLVLLQSRPITTALHRPTGPVLGPGPVAETFPDALAPLEIDLWVDPLREGLRHALAIAGVAPPPALRSSPLVTTVDGWVVVDLALLGALPGHRSKLAALDPRPGFRRLRASWRVGRLRGSLPGLGRDLVDEIDRDLGEVPSLDVLTNDELVGLLRTTGKALVALHGHEVLAGLLLGAQAPPLTGAAVGLAALAEGRAEGLDDDAIVARDPSVLALLPPVVGPVAALPADVPMPELAGYGQVAAQDVVREALRLRVRWVQELGARAAWALAGRLVHRGALAATADVRLLRLEELERMAHGGKAPDDLDQRVLVAATGVPAAFRMADDGAVVPVVRAGQAIGAGGGVGRGPVRHGDDGAGVQAGDVLVVRVLAPELASVLPQLAGLVAETGSVLSHVAILAREFGVPTVVGLTGAVDAYAAGTVVEVDGHAGRVDAVEATAAGGQRADGPPVDRTSGIKEEAG